jgi:predicted transposase/invertase (TIGR01784 family)
MEPLSPKNEFVFKKLFADPGHIEILIAFLASVLDISPDELVGLELVEAHILGDAPGDKECILDIRVVTRDGTAINVEIQLRPMRKMRMRILFYCSRLLAGQVRAGDNYQGMRKAVCIVIVDYNLIDESPERYHHCFRMYDREAGVEFSDAQEIHTLELSKLPKASDGGPLLNWLHFLAAKTEEEFEMAAQKDAAVGKAWTALKELSADEKTRLEAEAREKWRRDYEAYLDDAREEGEIRGEIRGEIKGLAKGKAEGLAEGLAEGEIKGLAKGKAEGLVEGQIQGILRVLTARFASAPDDIRQAVEAKTDLSALETLLIHAATCDTLDDFRRKLG